MARQQRRHQQQQPGQPGYIAPNAEARAERNRRLGVSSPDDQPLVTPVDQSDDTEAILAQLAELSGGDPYIENVITLARQNVSNRQQPGTGQAIAPNQQDWPQRNDWNDDDDWSDFTPFRFPKPEDGDIIPAKIDRTVNDHTLVQGAVYEFHGDQVRAKRTDHRWTLYRKNDGGQYSVLLDRRIMDNAGHFVGDLDDLGDPVWVPNRKPRSESQETIQPPPPVKRQRERISDQMMDVLMILQHERRMRTINLLRAIYKTGKPTKTQRAAFSRTLRKMVDYGYILLTGGQTGEYAGQDRTAVLICDDDQVRKIAAKHINR